MLGLVEFVRNEPAPRDGVARLVAVINERNRVDAGGEAATRIWEQGHARTIRTGEFWLPGERVVVDGRTYQHGAMYVTWQAPETVSRPHPVVLVHGRAVQGTEWMTTPDGRPGWAHRLVDAGYAVFVVDRPTQGRSPLHPDGVFASASATSNAMAYECTASR